MNASLRLLPILLIHGPTAFGQFNPPLPSFPEGMVLGDHLFGEFVDLNADGLRDLVLTRDNTVGYHPAEGGGTFGERVLLPLGPFGYSRSTFGDLDGDGALDILTGGSNGYDGYILHWQNDGAGAFEGPDTLMTQNMSTHRLLSADIDGDGDLDIVVHGYTQTVDLLVRAYINNGGGAWTAAGVTSEVPFVHVVDLDQDGSSEVITHDGSQIRLWSYNGTAMVQNAIISGIGIGDLRFADMDGNGTLDIVSADGNSTTTVWLNNGGLNSWSPPAFHSLSAPLEQPTWALGDMNGDGTEDILWSSPAGLLLFANDGSGAGFTEVALPQPLADYWSSEGPGFYPGGWNITSVYDVDSDGDLDVLSGLEVLTNDGNGQFLPSVMLRPELRHHPEHLTYGDLDGDGLDDIVMHQAGWAKVEWCRNEGSGVFAMPQPVILAHGTGKVKVIDMDGDGLQDVVLTIDQNAALTWARNEGGGQFVQQPPILNGITEDGGRIFAVADMDGDGDGDVVYTESFQGLFLLTNEGNGSFSTSAIDEFLDTWGLIMAMTDLEGDGDQDIVRYEQGLGPVLLLNNGDGTWENVIDPGFEFSPGGYELEAFVDMDQDGDADGIVFMCMMCDDIGFPLVSWQENMGDQGWGPLRGIMWPVGEPFSQEAQGYRMDDVDHDGDPDLLVQRYVNGAYSVSLAQNLGGGVFDTLTVVADDQFLEVGTANILGGSPARDIVVLGPADAQEQFSHHYIGNPGTQAFQIRGHLFIDQDQNGLRDQNEPPVAGRWVGALPTGSGALSFVTGEYVLLTPAGTHTVQAPAELQVSPIWGFTTATEHTVQIDNGSPISAGNDIGLVAVAANNTFEIVAERGQNFCGGEVPAWFTITNMGTEIQQGVFTVQFDSLFVPLDFVPMEPEQTDSTIIWHFGPLAPFQSATFFMRTISPLFDAMGSLILFSTTVETQDGQGIPTGTFGHDLRWIYECAYDPNDKQVSPVGYGSSGAVDIATPHLEYTIRFQNTGTAPAYHVKLLDELPAELDPARIELLGYSHAPSVIGMNADGVLEVRFIHIMLPDSASNPAGSQGFIRLRIGVREGLPHGTEITNSAGIYFDLNPPIITNTTLTTLIDCDLWTPTIQLAGTGLLQAPEGDAYQWFFNGTELPDTTALLIATDPGDYTVSVTSEHGCTALSAPYTVITTGIADASSTWFAVRPNPFRNTARIVSNVLLTPQHRIDVLDLQGRLVHATAGTGSNELVIAGEGLATGTYMVRIVHNGFQLGMVRVVVE